MPLLTQLPRRGLLGNSVAVCVDASAEEAKLDHTSKDAPRHYTLWAISLTECHIMPNYQVNSAYTLLRGAK